MLTVREDQIEGPLDQDLRKLLPAEVEMVRTSAVPVRPFRVVGDMGLRCLWHHRRALERLCREGKKPDLLFIPGPPWFMFLLGPFFLKRCGIPYVLDYIDPWISDWTGEAPFLTKRWAYHRAAKLYEGRVLRHAAHVTAVSEGILEDLRKRYPFLSIGTCTAMPYGGNPDDFEAVRRLGVKPPDFDPSDGNFHVCFTGALQPRGFEILKAVFSAARLVRERRPDLFRKMRLRFYGTSNLTWGRDQCRVLPLAKEWGLEKSVTEMPQRIPYLQSLAVQANAALNLVMGSWERYYHASKLYSCLLAGRPLIAVCHAEASIVHVLRNLGMDGAVIFSSPDELSGKAGELCEKMVKLLERREVEFKPDMDRFEPYSAAGVTRVLAGVFDKAAGET